MAIRLSENFRALFYAPFYAAHAIDAYRAEGVDVRLMSSTDPAHTAAALRAGEIDVMWGGPLRVILTHAQDPSSDTVCFCDVIARDPFFIVGREPRPEFHLRDLADIRFASVAEVPTPWLCLQDDLRRAGLDPASLQRTDGPSMAENAAALRAGELDAVQLFQPDAEELITSGAGYIWYAAASRSLTAYTTFVTRRSVLATRRDELLAMTRAMRRTLRWIADTPGAEIANVLVEFFPAINHTLFAASIDRYRALQLFAVSPVLQREGYARLHAAMRSGGALQSDVSFDACVDNSIAEQAIAQP